MPFLRQDLLYTLRSLRKAPGFTIVVIGATTAMFSVVQGVMLAPLPYREPDKLVLIWQSNPHAPHVSLSLPDLREWQRNAHSFDAISGLRWYQVNLTSPGRPEHVNGNQISSGLFQVLGVQGERAGRELSPIKKTSTQLSQL